MKKQKKWLLPTTLVILTVMLLTTVFSPMLSAAGTTYYGSSPYVNLFDGDVDIDESQYYSDTAIQKLPEKVDDDQIISIIVQMSGMSLLDDRKTAEQVVARCIAKGYGLARAKQALYEKRIPKEFWVDALADYPDQLENIMEFLESRLGDEPNARDLKRAIDALLRRGHSYGTIRRAMQEMAIDPHDFPEV
jgi:SOS response regulatory protein OraA/RecX